MAVYANLSIDQGSNFSATITVEDQDGIRFDLTGYTARGQIRKTYSSSSAVNFTVEISNVPTSGKIEISLTANQTLEFKPGRYVYDIEIVQSSGSVTRVIEGQVDVNPRVTKILV